MDNKIPVVLISGPVGVGKTSVGNEVAKVLERNRTPHTFIDFDQIRYTYPRPDDDPWGNQLGFANLAAIWGNCSRSGSLNLVVSYVVEDISFINMLLEVIPEAEVKTMQLSASLETLEARLSVREIGSGLNWHISRSAELADSLAEVITPSDYRINTDRRTVIEIAEEIVKKIDWRIE